MSLPSGDVHDIYIALSHISVVHFLHFLHARQDNDYLRVDNTQATTISVLKGCLVFTACESQVDSFKQLPIIVAVPQHLFNIVEKSN